MVDAQGAHAQGEPVRTARVRHIAAGLRDERGPLLPVLHAVVAEFGHIADEDLAVIADVLNLSRADVHGVVSFYHDFRRTPPPAHRITLCRAEACQARGAEDLYAAAHRHFESRPEVEVTEVFCLGNCALGPAGTLDGRLLGRLDPARLASLTQGWTA